MVIGRIAFRDDLRRRRSTVSPFWITPGHMWKAPLMTYKTYVHMVTELCFKVSHGKQFSPSISPHTRVVSSGHSPNLAQTLQKVKRWSLRIRTGVGSNHRKRIVESSWWRMQRSDDGLCKQISTHKPLNTILEKVRCVEDVLHSQTFDEQQCFQSRCCRELPLQPR